MTSRTGVTMLAKIAAMRRQANAAARFRLQLSATRPVVVWPAPMLWLGNTLSRNPYHFSTNDSRGASCSDDYLNRYHN